MKRLAYIFVMAWLGSSALAVDKAELEKRVLSLTVKFEQMQEDPSTRIPAENLRKAQGIAMLDRTKAGFIFAFQGGSGVAMVKDPQSGQWGPVSFLKASEASVGFQIGGQKSFLVMLLMDTNATRLLTTGASDFGGEARGTAGDASGGAESSFSSKTPAILMYDARSGLYGGAALKGGDLSPDDDDNTVYYGLGLTAKEILFDHKVSPTEAALALARKIGEHSKK